MARLSGFILLAAQTAHAVRLDDTQLSGLDDSQTEGVIAGHKIHNYEAMFHEGREEFLRKVKHERDGREHFIIFLKALSQDKFDADTQMLPGVDVVGTKAGVPFIGFRGSQEELQAKLVELGDDVLSVEADTPISIPIGEQPLAQRNEQVKATSADSMCMAGHNQIGLSNRKYTGKGVHVYVLDTGIRASHNDFRFGQETTTRVGAGFEVRCNWDTGSCYKWFCEDDNDAMCREDPHGHGTHCAGTAAGIHYGVAPDANLYAVKILNADGSGTAEFAIAGVDMVIEKGKKPGVLSMSIGAPRSTLFDRAVGVAIDNGFIVVTASGNSDDDACGYSPAGIGRAITVGSAKWERSLYGDQSAFESESGFSNYGRCVDILAPGERVWSASAFDDDQSAMMDGTSMACPHVSGAAALILEQDAALDPGQVWAAMEVGYVQVGALTSTKYGTPNRRLKIGPQGEFCAQAFSPAFWPVALVLVALQAFV